LINAALTVKKLDELNSIKESHNKISEKWFLKHHFLITLNY
jgi:hypothetical protein